LCRWWRWWRQALRVLGASLYVNGHTPLLRPIERTSRCLANAGGSAAVGTQARLEGFPPQSLSLDPPAPWPQEPRRVKHSLDFRWEPAPQADIVPPPLFLPGIGAARGRPEGDGPCTRICVSSSPPP